MVIIDYKPEPIKTRPPNIEVLRKYKEMMKQFYLNNELKIYLHHEWKLRNHPKYLKYFELWVCNITETQIYYFNKEMNNGNI